jgi:hypothetical protein
MLALFRYGQIFALDLAGSEVNLLFASALGGREQERPRFAGDGVDFIACRSEAPEGVTAEGVGYRLFIKKPTGLI